MPINSKFMIPVLVLSLLGATACRNETSQLRNSSEAELANTGTQATGTSAGSTDTMAAAPTVAPTSGATSANPDQAFALKAASGGMAEVELGRLAAQKAASADVKQFGQKMVDDHSAANQELMQILGAKGITPPATLAPQHAQTRDRLNGLTGAEFDRAYMTVMMQDHDATVADFQNEATAGTDPQLKAFAAKTLPVIQQHAQLAHSIAGKLGLH